MKIFNLTIFYGMMLIKKYWVDSNLWPVAMLQIIFVEKKKYICGEASVSL